MPMSKVKVAVQGISPLLMHSYPLQPAEGHDKWTPEKQAEYCAYRDPETKELYVPGIALQRALVNGATFSKGKGRGSLQKVVAACVLVSPERLGLGTQKFVVDSRRVVIRATGGAVVRHRPRMDQWKISFEIQFDPLLLKPTEVRRVLDDTGSRVGLLDFRPEKKGPFGRFMVTEWKEL